MKNLIVLGIVVVIAVMSIFGIYTVYKKVTKEFHNATTPISVKEPAPGYICFLATGNDSVAISCLKK